MSILNKNDRFSPNYCATLVKITKVHPLENCDNLVGTILFGNHVIVSKDVQLNQLGVYFPVETLISHDFLHINNLYSNKELNKDKNIAGYFGKNRRVRAVKLRGNVSDGIWLPFSSITNFLQHFYPGYDVNIMGISENLEFNEVLKHHLCEKYVAETKTFQTKKAIGKQISRLVNPWKFHEDTPHLGKNLDKIELNDIVSITKKYHGTSFIVGNVEVYRELTFLEKLLKKFGVKVDDKEYDTIYSSRTVIRNNAKTSGFYDYDIWGDVARDFRGLLHKGEMVYGEIVGFTKDGKPIQKHYDYGCLPSCYRVYIYRIIQDGLILSARQTEARCKQLGFHYVESYYYGHLRDLLGDIPNDWPAMLVDFLSKRFNIESIDHQCFSKVPFEGIVISVEKGLDVVNYKLKSFMFKEHETKQLDKNVPDIEGEN